MAKNARLSDKGAGDLFFNADEEITADAMKSLASFDHW
jgi:hypothetical protein